MVNEILNNINKENFDLLLKLGKRGNYLYEIELPGLIYMSYGFVKIELPDLLTKGSIQDLIQSLCKERNIAFKEAVSEKEITALVLWLKDELEQIFKLESEYLSNPPEPDMIAAGVKELDEMGEINVIDSLAGGDVLKWDLVKALPYHVVFDKLRKNLLEARVNKNYQRIITRKK